MMANVDDHARVSPMGGDKICQHNVVREILFLAVRGATLSIEKESKCLVLWCGQKLGDLIIHNFFQGFHTSAFDVSIAYTLQIWSLDREPFVMELLIVVMSGKLRMGWSCISLKAYVERSTWISFPWFWNIHVVPLKWFTTW